jgi:DNA-binding CsgD family transcriptional regulator
MNRIYLFAAGALALFSALMTMEIYESGEHFTYAALADDVLETLLLVGAITLTSFFAIETRSIRVERTELVSNLNLARQESERWRQAARNHVQGLSGAIATQFRNWALTEAEADVAGLMLKGLSHKEIAALRACSEATVRQHAAVVYRKSNLNSRSQLTGFFLEDLLIPQAERDAPNLKVIHDSRA